VFALDGVRRELATLSLAVIWLGTILSMSFIAPMAAILGLLVLLLSRYGLKRPYPGISTVIVLMAVLAAIHPEIRARWHPAKVPVRPMLETAEPVFGGEQPDSLRLVFTNDGLLRWQPDWQAGYHTFEVVRGEEPELRHSGWVGSSLDAKVEPGDAAVVTLPAEGNEGRTLVGVDFRGPGGFLSGKTGLVWVLQMDLRRDLQLLRVTHLDIIRSSELATLASEKITDSYPEGRTIYRAEAWRDAMSLLKAKPVFGLGTGTMQAMLGYNAQNLPLQAAVDYGWFGLALILMLLIALIVISTLRRTLEMKIYAAILLVGVVHGFFEYVHDHFPVAVVTAILIGMAWAAAFEPVEDAQAGG
jgi:hypothetical protein